MAELFSLRPNFSDDLAELFFQELATLQTHTTVSATESARFWKMAVFHRLRNI
jgi:hypothetical protein